MKGTVRAKEPPPTIGAVAALAALVETAAMTAAFRATAAAERARRRFMAHSRCRRRTGTRRIELPVWRRTAVGIFPSLIGLGRPAPAAGLSSRAHGHRPSTRRVRGPAPPGLPERRDRRPGALGGADRRAGRARAAGLRRALHRPLRAPPPAHERAPRGVRRPAGLRARRCRLDHL